MFESITLAGPFLRAAISKAKLFERLMVTQLRSRTVFRVITAISVLALLRLIAEVVRFFLSGGVGRHRVEVSWLIFAALMLVVGAVRRIDRGVASDTAERRVGSSVRSAYMIVVTAFSAFLLYRGAPGLGLLSDDFVFVEHITQQSFLIESWEFFRPLPLILWRGLYAVGGPAAIHVFNIGVHSINAWLLYLVAMRATSVSSAAPVIASLLFLTHPAVVEPVAWASGVFDVLLTMFGLLYLLSASGDRTRWGSLLFLVFAVLTKETAISLPLIALVLRGRLRISVGTILASVAIVCVYIGIRLLLGTPDVFGSGPYRYIVKEFLVRPFATLGAPWARHELVRFPILLGIVPAVSIAAFLFRYVWVGRGIDAPARFVAWVMLAAMPVAGYFFVSDELQGSRYVYWPLCGWSLFVAEIVCGSLKVPRWGPVTTVVALVALSSVWGVRQHLQPWMAAAATRDAVLQAAEESARGAGCKEAFFSKAPDHVRGAYVFRNGLAEALRIRRTVSVSNTPSTVTPECRFVWTGDGFRAEPQEVSWTASRSLSRVLSHPTP